MKKKETLHQPKKPIESGTLMIKVPRMATNSRRDLELEYNGIVIIPKDLSKSNAGCYPFSNVRTNGEVAPLRQIWK